MRHLIALVSVLALALTSVAIAGNGNGSGSGNGNAARQDAAAEALAAELVFLRGQLVLARLAEACRR